MINYKPATPERWQSGRMRRFAKPLYGLTPVPRVRIPPSPPLLLLSGTCKLVIPTLIPSWIGGIIGGEHPEQGSQPHQARPNRQGPALLPSGSFQQRTN